MANGAGTVESEIPRETVLAELEKVLSSAVFINTRRLGAFLGHVVRQTLDGNAENLKEYQLGLDVFGRRESYDPRTDPVVRVGRASSGSSSKNTTAISVKTIPSPSACRRAGTCLTSNVGLSSRKRPWRPARRPRPRHQPNASGPAG